MDIVMKEQTAEGMAKRLLKTALGNSRCLDNVTVTVVCL